MTFAQQVEARNKQLPPYDKNKGKIFNFSYAYRKFTQHHIAQKQFTILRLVNKVMTENLSRVNHVSPPKIARQQV